MLRFLCFPLLGCLLLVLPATAQKYDITLAEAPVGFHWQALPEVKAAMLLPDGWYYKAEHPKGTDAYFLSQEEIGEAGEFQTGMSLNVVAKVKAKTNRSAADYAQAFNARAGGGPGQQVLARHDTASGVFRTSLVRYRAAPPDADSKIISQWAIANTKTDTIYLLVFESPEKDWVGAWQLGAVMMRELVLDSHR